MATEASFNQEDEDESERPLPAGGGDVTSQADAGGGSAPAPMANRTPSGTPNIQSYLKANQGAGQQLAQGIGNQFQKQTNQFGQQVNQASQKLNAQANPLQEKLGDQASNTIKTSFQNPQDILAKQDQLKQFQMLRDKGYQGDINTLGQNAQTTQQGLQTQLGNMQQQAKGAGTEAGRFQLLRNTFGQPQYTQGQQKLDQLFLQSQPGANKGLQQNLTNQTNQVKQQLGSTGNEIQAKLNALGNMSNQNAQQIQDTLKTGNLGGQKIGSGFDDITSNVNKEYQDALANSNLTDTNITEAMKNRQLTPEIAQQLGLTTGQSAWGTDISPYYTKNALNAADQGGNAQVASPEEFARFNALNQLAGNTQQNIFGDATTAGGYKPFNFRTEDFNTAVSDRQKAITQTDLANTIGSIKSSPAVNDILRSMQQQVSAGKLSPDQAKQQLEELGAKIYKINGEQSDMGYTAGVLNPFMKYYNQKYLPAANDIIGQSSPEQSPLPTTEDGQTDWTKLPTPGGAAGKGAAEDKKSDKYLKGK